MKERRSTPPPEPLAPEFRQAAGGREANQLKDPWTGLYTMATLLEFIRYEIDGGAQTERNERFVTPVCAVAIGVDALSSIKDESARARLTETVGRTIGKITRRSDRLARKGDDFVALLRRTLSKKAREHYAPHLAGSVMEVTREIGLATTLCLGIVSLTEHLVKDPGDMVTKAFTALEAARKNGPGSVVVYDLREMK
jgi:diguanylate cyclase (GGDEF)-like protein